MPRQMHKALRRMLGEAVRDASPVGDDMTFRMLELRSSSLNIDERSIEALASTETPVMMPDWERMEMVPEVLLTSGAELPKSRQVPLLDSHQRASMATQLGSARNLEKTDSGVASRLFFSTTAESEWTKVREGHARDVSAGYQVLKKIFIPTGETKSIGGRSFTGPVNVVTKWKLREVSLTPIGADEQAKLRGLDPTALQFPRWTEEGFHMNPELRKLLETRGMPKDLNDVDAQKWLVDNQARILAAEAAPVGAPPPAAGAIDTRAAAAPLTVEQITLLATTATRAALQAEREEARVYDDEIRSLCELAGFADDFSTCRTMKSAVEVRAHLVAKQKAVADGSAVHPATQIRITGEGFERFTKDIGTAFVMRAAASVAETPEVLDKAFPVAERGKGWEQFKNVSIYQVAEECLRAGGVDVRGATREQVAIAAMFGAEKAGLTSRGAAYHVTGNFLKITGDAVNKSAMVGYTQAPSTWKGPMRQGDSVSDFKTIHRIRMGAIPNLPIWPDNTDPQKVSLGDAEETYGIESRSAEISFSYRLLVNDDMSMLSRVPSMMGAAGTRTVNAVAWAALTANPLMQDAIALFSAATGARKRQNLTTGAGTPTTTNIAALTKLMRLMRGENTPEGNESDDVLNLQPVYIVGPAALELLIGQAVNSAYDPNATAGMQGVYNPSRVLTPVIEPLLDANSATAWYLFASPSQIDTIEVTFLQGQENPVLRPFMDERSLSQSWFILQTFAAKAMNHRGVQRHDGV